jgi:hypothetical protein
VAYRRQLAVCHNIDGLRLVLGDDPNYAATLASPFFQYSYLTGCRSRSSARVLNHLLKSPRLLSCSALRAYRPNAACASISPFNVHLRGRHAVAPLLLSLS